MESKSATPSRNQLAIISLGLGILSFLTLVSVMLLNIGLKSQNFSPLLSFWSILMLQGVQIVLGMMAFTTAGIALLQQIGKQGSWGKYMAVSASVIVIAVPLVLVGCYIFYGMIVLSQWSLIM